MHIAYIDESGNVERAGTTPYFVLLALAIPATTWREKDAQVGKLLDRHNIIGEIHTAWMAKHYPEQARITGFDVMGAEARRAAVELERKADIAKASLKGQKAVRTLHRNYKKTAPYVHLTQAERLAALDDLADLVGSWDDSVLFCDALLKEALQPSKGDGTVLDFAFEQVVTRFNTYLGKIDSKVGILVQDQNETTATRLTALARRFHEDGTLYTEIDRVVETPLFVNSQLTSMVQLADLSAYAVRRFFENKETRLFNRIYPRFHRVGNKLVGFRHYTGKKKCNCRVCKDHGRY